MPTRSTTGARSLRRGVAWVLATCLVALVVGLSGCDTRRPGGYRPQQRVPTVPITRSERERPNKITYYLASMTQKEDRVVVDMDLMNGLGRGFQSVTVWVTLLGSQGEKYRVPYALGPLGPHAQDHVIVKAEGITYLVDDIQVGVQLQ